MQPILALALGLVCGLAITWAAGENPWHVLRVLVKSAFGSGYDIGMTLFYATPLIFTGLSVAVAFQAGLFNIGAEGQLTMGALAAAATGALWPRVPSPMAPILASMAAVFAGVVWGGIAGWLRAKRGSHEVINTIMLNFIAAGLTSWITLYILRNPNSQNPETALVGLGYRIPPLPLFDESHLSIALPLALLTAFLVWVFLWKTALGYEIRA